LAIPGLIVPLVLVDFRAPGYWVYAVVLIIAWIVIARERRIVRRWSSERVLPPRDYQ
jgi:hypothetical protein